MAITYKYLVKKYFLRAIAVRLLQPLFILLHKMALVGMNIGPVGEVETSGETVLAKRILRSLPGNSVIVDVGANVGQFTIMCARYAPPNTIVIAFEPAPSIFRTLEINVTKAGIKEQTRLVGKGLSDRGGLAMITVAPGFEGNSSIRARPQDYLTASSAEPITLTTLDDYCTSESLTHIDFIKVDIEGEELACLRGARRMLAGGHIDYLQFEFGGCNIQSRVFFKDFWDLLTPAYRVHRVLRDSLYPITRYNELLEVFTTTNFLAVRQGLPAL